jgi:hypothetical protein
MFKDVDVVTIELAVEKGRLIEIVEMTAVASTTYSDSFGDDGIVWDAMC